MGGGGVGACRGGGGWAEWGELVTTYKAKVLSYVESRTPAIYHATDTTLKQLEAMQNRVLRELDVRAKDALLEWSLAPLSTRRDVAMLGVIHRAV